MGGKASKPTVQTVDQTQNQSGTSTSAPNPVAMQAYQDLLAQAQQIGSQPFVPYSGEMVAPVNAQQMAGIAGINAAANQAQPYIAAGQQFVSGVGGNIANVGNAANAAMTASQPIGQSQIEGYLNPYTSDVVKAAEAEFANMNAMQQQGILSGAAAQGALGGDRVAVAQANLAHQQALAENPVIASLLSQGYSQAVNTALAEQQAGMQGAGLAGNLNLGAGNLGLGAGYTEANLGVAGQQAALQGAGAQISAGTLQQQTQQAADQAAMQQYYTQQGFPYQQAQWLAGMATGLGSQMGATNTTTGTSTSSGTQVTTPPPPSFLGQLAGLGMIGASFIPGVGPAAQAAMIGAGGSGLFGGHKSGGRIRGYDDGGAVAGVAPYSGGRSYIPQIGMTRGALPGAPQINFSPLQFSSPQQSGGSDIVKNAMNLAGQMKGILGDEGSGGYTTKTGQDPKAAMYAPENPMENLPGFGPDYSRLGAFRRGGHVPTISGFGTGGIILPKGYADGGDADMADLIDDRFPQAGGINAGSFVNNPGGIAALRDYGVSQAPAMADTAAQIANVPMPRSKPVMDELPPEITAGVSRPSPIPPTMAMGFDDEEPGSPRVSGVAPAAAPPTIEPSAPAEEERRGLFGLPSLGGALGLPKMSDAARVGLLAAGLGMLSSRSPYAGVAIGEGGLQGVGAYMAQRRQDAQLPKLQAETERLQTLAKKAQQDLKYETEHGGMTPYQDASIAETRRQRSVAEATQKATEQYRKDQLAEQRRQHDLSLRTPVVYGEDARGRKLYALPKPSPDGAVEYWPIDPKTHEVGSSPLGGSLKDAAGRAEAQQPPSGLRTAAMTEEDAVSAAPPPEIRAQALPGSKQARNDAYLGYLANDIGGVEGAKYAKLIKGIADYQINPNALFSLRGNQRQKALEDVLMYDPTYDQRRFGQTNRAISGWAQSPEGRATRSLSVVVEHLATAEDLGRALQNGDTQLLNSLRNSIKTQFGYEGPVNFAFAKQIVADEIAKAVIGGPTAEGDRRGLQAQLSTASSPEQLAGVIRTAKELMGGQLVGLKHTYETATGLHNFDQWMTPRARESVGELMELRERKIDAQHNRPQPTQKDRDYVKAHPEMRDKFIKRFGVEP